MVTAPASLKDTPRTRRLNRKPARISLHKAMNLFFDRDDSELKFGTRTDYENTLMILEHYVDSFGTVLLRASGSKPTLPKPKSGPVSKRYDPASFEQFFRGFVLFSFNTNSMHRQRLKKLSQKLSRSLLNGSKEKDTCLLVPGAILNLLMQNACIVPCKLQTFLKELLRIVRDLARISRIFLIASLYIWCHG